MTVKEMNQIVLELVGLTEMSEDSGIVFDNGKEIKKILAGIDMDTSMLILAKQLGFDCVAQHHPAGIINANTFELFGRDHMKKLMECGVPINVAQKLAYKNSDVRKRGMHSRNRTQMRDVASLLDICDVAYHTPADMLAERAAQKKMDALMERNSRCTVQDVIDELLTIREYAEALEGQKPEVWVGSKESFAGRIYVEMYGVGAPSPEEYIACSDAGIGTFVGMHATPEVIEAMKNHGKSNLIIAGHMASDSLGFNQILDAWAAKGIEIVRIAGIT
ncbi:MAG: NGG1p interacting factor NIF3 [Symbiobacteriaceae bacterium]|nr:NGG1p interacting factor NIF3 [Symbiobacteriaceae bacterium]